MKKGAHHQTLTLRISRRCGWQGTVGYSRATPAGAQNLSSVNSTTSRRLPRAKPRSLNTKSLPPFDSSQSAPCRMRKRDIHGILSPNPSKRMTDSTNLPEPTSPIPNLTGATP